MTLRRAAITCLAFLIDRVFPSEQAPQAFELMDNGSYLGKIVIKL